MSEQILETTVLCTRCGQPMQMIAEIVDVGIVKQRSFVCTCQGVVTYRNFHRIVEPGEK